MRIHEKIVLELLEKIESAGEWEKPFKYLDAENIFTKKEYTGINRFILGGGQYATFKQIKSHGGTIKKGAKSEQVLFFSLIEKDEIDEKTGKKKTIPCWRYYNVFNIDDTEGLEKYKSNEMKKFDSDENLEKVIENYKRQLGGFSEEIGRAFYKKSGDLVNVPPKNTFISEAEYYSTAFHEFTHSTGIKERLSRAGIEDFQGFGSETYSREELVAEIGSMLCLKNTPHKEQAEKNSVAYLKSWISRLKDKPSELITAFSQSEKASKYILENNV